MRAGGLGGKGLGEPHNRINCVWGAPPRRPRQGDITRPRQGDRCQPPTLMTSALPLYVSVWLLFPPCFRTSQWVFSLPTTCGRAAPGGMQHSRYVDAPPTHCVPWRGMPQSRQVPYLAPPSFPTRPLRLCQQRSCMVPIRNLCTTIATLLLSSPAAPLFCRARSGAAHREVHAVEGHGLGGVEDHVAADRLAAGVGVLVQNHIRGGRLPGAHGAASADPLCCRRTPTAKRRGAAQRAVKTGEARAWSMWPDDTVC